LMAGDEEVFVRTIEKKVGGKSYRYAYLVENQRVGGRIKQRLVLNLGAAHCISTRLGDGPRRPSRPQHRGP